VVFGIASQEPQGDVQEYIDQLGVTFPVLMDPNGTVHAQYQQQSAFPSAAYPQDWVIGPDSKILYRNNGYELDAILSVLGVLD
jgi:peroxiredoxin